MLSLLMIISPAKAYSGQKSSELLKHIAALDGVRGAAIGMVLMYHLLNSASSHSHILQILFAIREAGWIGVDLFFCLSGFLITGILFDSMHDTHYFRNFYARRLLRIFPLYYAVLGCIVLYLIISNQVTRTILNPLTWVAVFLENTPLYLDHAKNTAIFPYTAHLWSLAVEEQFYLVWPVLIYLLRDRRRLLFLACALFAAALVIRCVLVNQGVALDYIYRYTLCRQDSLLGGAWLALAVRGPAKVRTLRTCRVLFPIAVMALIVLDWGTGDLNFGVNRSLACFGYSIIAVACTALVGLALTQGSLTSRALSWQPIRSLGKYSFGIYLIDSIVERVISPWFFNQRTLGTLEANVLLHVVYFGSVLGITLLLAMLSFRFYEQPFLRLKRAFVYQRLSGSR